MTKMSDIADKYDRGEDLSRDEVGFLLDVAGIQMGYILASGELPQGLCEKCEYKQEGVDPQECERPIDDCIPHMEQFFEDAVNTWLSTRNNSEEVKQ